ncbi:MAG: argininosuccinate lyase [Gammaproteobacteria bacterium]|nr:argininosuccinate lyase [Gammaproteobacteria bacterium]
MAHKKTQDDGKIWGGRFSEGTNAFVERFTASISFDKRLYQHDIDGSIAHAKMLAKGGIITDIEESEILAGLEDIRKEIADDNFEWSVKLEDIHMNIESALTKKIGEIGKKLHTGRSRNDQIATDIRLYARDQLDQISNIITLVQRNLLDLAERESNTIIPGFTHLQVAQPITFGHHMMAWFEMLNRDFERFQDCRKRLNRSPLGSAALAGTTFPIDRQYTADLLGFDSPIPNSLDAVSDRDFIIEIAAAGSLLMTHLSRFSEEIVLWTSAQFNFIELPDEYCTGSSIMPQKKNPDVPELVRGKSGRVLGHLVSLITLMKSQPLDYNKDNQEDKEPLFDLIDTIKDCLYAYSQIIPAIKCNKISMRLSATKGFSTATDLADYIVKKGLAFRDAHEIVGKTVAYAIREGIDLAEIPLDKFSEFSPLIEDDVFKVLTLEGSVNARSHFGGTAPNQVLTSIEIARSNLEMR